MKKPLVSIHWLHDNLASPKLIILDATLKKATSKEEIICEKKQLPKARFFDIKNTFSEQSSTFPNTMLTFDKFQEKAQDLGINNDSIIIVYDDFGIYSSARVWWMFKAMGYHNVAVLDGGFPAWKNAGYSIENITNKTYEKGNFSAKPNPKYFCDYKTVLNAVSDTNTTILDARSTDRFYAKIEEPRKGLRSGHIPNSLSLPYSELIANGKMKSSEEIKKIVSTLNVKGNNLIFSCGSGVTACILALATEIIGIQNKTVYDGSWTEWGSLHNLPIEL